MTDNHPGFSPDDLFRTPPPRPMPTALLDRVEAELAEAPEPQTGRSSRWAAPLVAAGLLAAVAGGGLLLQHRTIAPASPSPSASATSTSTATSTATPAMVSRCLDQLRQHPPADLQMRPEAPVRWAVSAGGDAAVLYDANDQYVACGDTVTSAPADAGLADQVVVRSYRSGADTIVYAVGRLQSSGQQVWIDDQQATLAGNVWVWSHRYTAAEMATQPAQRAIQFQDLRTSKGPEVYVSWPGHVQAASSRDATLARCRDSAPSATEVKRWTTASTVWSPDGSTVLLVDGSGRSLLCGPDLAMIADVTTGTPFESGSQGTSQGLLTTIASGVAPAGVTAVTVESSLGSQPATLQGRRWVWSDNHSLDTVGVLPSSYRVVYHRGSVATATDMVVTSDSRASLNTAPTAWGTWWRGDDVSKDCTTNGAQAVVSDGGHVAASHSGDVLTWCTGFGSGSTGHLSSHSVSATPGAIAAGTFAVQTADLSVGRPGLVVAAGMLPKGVTGVSYVTRHGEVTATVTDDMFLYEQAETAYQASDLPTAVHVTGPGLDRTIPLG